MPLTASNTDACTIAALRDMLSGLVATGSTATWNITEFQYVISSARAEPTRIAAERSGTKARVRSRMTTSTRDHQVFERSVGEVAIQPVRLRSVKLFARMSEDL